MNTEQLFIHQHYVRDFIAALKRLNASDRARLRRNAGRTLTEGQDIFFQALLYDLPSWQHEDYFLVAALYPLASHRPGVGSLGMTLRRVRYRRSQGGEGTDRLDRHFQTLIDSDREHVPFHLRQVVRLAAADRLPIDWANLLHDVMAWEDAQRSVQLHWATDYYVGGAPVETANPQPSAHPFMADRT